MRVLTILAVATVAAGLYHYQHYQVGRRAARLSELELARKVRAAIEAVVANPGDVVVRVASGIVALRGKVRKVELDRVLAAALAVPGVAQVTNLLEVDEAIGEIGPMQPGIATGI
jgi:osmotically-inducible protein OsmY